MEIIAEFFKPKTMNVLKRIISGVGTIMWGPIATMIYRVIKKF